MAFWRRIFLLAALMTFSGAALHGDEAAVTVFDGKSGLDFLIFRTGESGGIGGLIPALRRNRIRRVGISVWSKRPGTEKLLDELRDAGFEVPYFLTPVSGAAEWERRDLVGGIFPEPSGAGTPDYVPLPISDTLDNRSKCPSGFRAGIGFVTIHNTAEPFSAREERNRVDARRDSRTSFHFAVDEREIVRVLQLWRHGWHAGDGTGDGNLRSIGVEICRSQHRGKNDWMYLRSEENAVLLSAALLLACDLPPEALRMHRDWSGKYCPHRILEVSGWDGFKRRVAAAMLRPEACELAKRLKKELRSTD